MCVYLTIVITINNMNRDVSILASIQSFDVNNTVNEWFRYINSIYLFTTCTNINRCSCVQ